MIELFGATLPLLCHPIGTLEQQYETPIGVWHW